MCPELEERTVFEGVQELRTGKRREETNADDMTEMPRSLVYLLEVLRLR